MKKEEQTPEVIEVVEDVPMPSMNVNVPAKKDEQQTAISNMVPDEQLLGMYSEIVNTIKDDKKSIDDAITFFSNIVINEGDGTTSSKEALVNLLKVKADQSDKLTKIAELMTRIKLKDRDTFPRYLAQNNTINVGNSGSRRTLLEALKKAKQSKEEENQ
jgi:hypothetical protein